MVSWNPEGPRLKPLLFWPVIPWPEGHGFYRRPFDSLRSLRAGSRFARPDVRMR